jgi:iron complex outermembrane receptor protein
MLFNLKYVQTQFLFRKFALSTFLIFSILALNAQTHGEIISGQVVDAGGLPLPYVRVGIKGTAASTVTDELGHYFLKVLPGRYLLVTTAEGYRSSETQVNVQTGKPLNVSFKLMPDLHTLKDVTVSGVRYKSATATRTLTQIQDIPQSIVVIGQKVIKQQAAIDLTTITRNISGLNFTGNYSGAGSSQFFNARGFDLNDYQNYRWNGMMIYNLGNNYSDNIEQVEFLKGPSSILFGDVAPGGVMNFVTKKPLATFMANVNLKTGSWGLIRPALDITGPLTPDHSVRFRLNTSFEKSNSFRNYVSSQREFIAPTLAWDLTHQLSLNIETVFKKSRATDDAGLVSPNGTINGLKTLDPSLYLGESSRNYLYSEQDYFGTLSYTVRKNRRLKATAFFGNTTNRPFGVWFDQPDSAGNFGRRTYGLYQKTKTHTLSVESNCTLFTGPVKHNFLIGMEYQSLNYRYTNSGLLTLTDTDNIYHPDYGSISNAAPAKSPLQPYVSIVTRLGFYVQDQAMFFNEKLHLLLGARMGNTRQGNHYYQNQLAGTEYAGYTDNIISKNVFTPRIGVVFKPREWTSYYVSYSKGYEVNSPDLFAQNYLQYATPPATISTQVEFGIKANLLNNKLGVTLSAFEINKHNPYGYVYLNPLDPDYDEYNVYYQGHHRSRGVELDVQGMVFATLSLTGGAAYTKTRVMDDPGYPTGNVLPNAPTFTGNVWLNYEPLKKLSGFSLASGLFYKSSFFSGIANDPKLKIPAGYTLDVAAGYKYKQMGIQINAMNITNRVSYLNPWQFNMFDVKPLRQFVVTLNYTIGKP